jgi:hypothetical protein
MRPFFDILRTSRKGFPGACDRETAAGCWRRGRQRARAGHPESVSISVHLRFSSAWIRLIRAKNSGLALNRTKSHQIAPKKIFLRGKKEPVRGFRKPPSQSLGVLKSPWHKLQAGQVNSRDKAKDAQPQDLLRFLCLLPAI